MIVSKVGPWHVLSDTVLVSIPANNHTVRAEIGVKSIVSSILVNL